MMKAIVLSHDANHGLALNMVAQYHRLWPRHPFHFIIPYQDQIPTGSLSNVTLKKTKNPIKATVLTLLEGIPDDEWIYWAIDDKFPLALARFPYWWTVRLLKNEALSVDAVCLCRARGFFAQSIQAKAYRAGGMSWHERTNLHHLWLHQFMKAGLLRNIFEHFPNELFAAKQMDDFVDKMQIPKNKRLIVSHHNYVVLKESSSRGKIYSATLPFLRANNVASEQDVTHIIDQDPGEIGQIGRPFRAFQFLQSVTP